MESTSPATSDLPVAQPAGALAYPQGFPMGMPQFDDADGGDGFSVMGFVHSLRRQWVLALGLGLVVSSLMSIVLYFLIPVTYKAEAVLRVSRELSQGNSADFMIYKETQGGLIKSPFVINAALRDNDISQLPMVLTDSWGRRRKKPEAWLAGAISVTPDESELLWISMTGRDKQQTEKILEKVIEAHQTEIVNKERLEKVDTHTKLRKRYVKLFGDIKKKTDEVNQLARQLGAVSDQGTSQKQTLIISQLNMAQREVDRMRMLLLEAQNKYQLLLVESRLGGGTPSEYLILDELEKDARYFQTTQFIDELKDEVEQLSTTYRPNSVQLQQLQTEIARLERKRNKLASELRPRAIARIQAQNGASPSAIQRELALQQQQLVNYGRLAQQAMSVYEAKFEEIANFAGANGDLEARMDDLMALRRDMQTVRADMQRLEIELDGPTKVTVIQNPMTSKASSMKTKLAQIAGGWVISLFGVIAAVAYWDYLAKKVNGEEDVTRSVRVIGTLPAIQRGISGGARSIEEAMKVAIDAVRTAILYNRERAPQCVMVTSGMGEEGRSTVASQLAVSMARAGKTTLLIDADLRNPQQHAIFDVQPHGGLSEMLRKEQTSDQAIVATAVENVWLLSAGRCDQTALQGLSGEQAKAVFQDFRDRFDVIIMDASPVLTSPDSLLMGQHADAVILSVRRDVSQIPKVTAALDRLASVGVPVLGAVVNGPSVELRSGERMMTQESVEEDQPALTNA